ncbi:MAG: clostripain-related cysteine peptidase, partial [Saprospiraceae bacterium]
MSKLKFLLFSMLVLTFTVNLQAQKKWTYMVYLFGSDLEGGFEKNQGQYGDAGTNDIIEMMQTGSTENVNVIVMTGGADKDGWRELKRWKIENGQQVPIEFNAPNDRMGDPNNLTEFINWATANYPAEQYVLDLWNHGSDIQGYGGDELPNNNHESFKIPQLKQAIQNSSFINQGNKFEILGFDACLMANLEVHNAMQSFANYIVSSEQLEPGHGWDYDPIIRAMENGSATDGITLGKVIADGFLAQANYMGTNQVTLSVIETSKINNVITAVNEMLAVVGTDGTADLQQARSRSEDYASTSTGQDAANNHDVVDIGHLAENLKAVNSSYTNSANTVINALNDAVKYTVKDFQQPNSTGLSLFVPHKLFGAQEGLDFVFNNFYNSLNFSPSIKDFIKKYTETAQSSDNDAPSGDEADPNSNYNEWEEGDFRSTEMASSRNNNDQEIARVIVNDPSDLETVRVLLIETNALEDENDFLTLGAVQPDRLRYSNDGRLLIEYDWDQEWLGIGGHPVNIQNIKQTASDGRLLPINTGGGCTSCPDLTRGGDGFITTITIPAILNPDEDFFGRDVYLNYVKTENGYELISIIPQREEGEPNQGQKERLNLVSGDRVMLLYDGFNEVSDELFEAVAPDAVFTIENGNQDLNLEPILLPLGAEFRIAFELIDFSQQNTIIYDPRNFAASEIMLGDIVANGSSADRTVCTGDGQSDIITFGLQDCNTDNITYVLTTGKDIILGPFSGKMEFDGAPVYDFR